MSIWIRITDALGALTAGEGLSEVFSKLRTRPERTVGFTIAVIALGAKMAKADGQVTRDEVAAFREVFTIPDAEEKNAARLFNMARRDVAGFEIYAKRIAAMFDPGDPALVDLVEGLFHIAMADGEYHPGEEDFVARVASILSIAPRDFRSLQARFVPGAAPDPYDVLGVPHGASEAEVRAAWRRAVRESHPDALAARGLPEEALRMAEKRLIAINAAWEELGK